ncbi:MAG: hypothetical protein BIFFINMI_00411 [Phycisphaerae bacterium]|nr:hypothetical protein [Phycisphaerae bacterium]
MAAIEVEVSEIDNGIVARISGDAGLAGVDALARHLLRLSARRDKLVVLDMAGLKFMSSLAMGRLVEFHRGVVRNGGAARYACVQPLVRQALERARLTDLIELYDTVESASAVAG